MMMKIFLISACVAASANVYQPPLSAFWESQEKDDNPSSARIRRMANLNSQFDSTFTFPNGFPRMPNFPEMNMPEIKMPEIKFPEIKFPDIKFRDIKIPDIKISTPEEIASHKERWYNGVSMVTSSNGDTVYTINDGGHVNTYTVPAGSSEEKTAEILAEPASNN